MATEEPDRSAQERCVIFNADDFGLTDGINRGIIEAHEHGVVTSASLMVRHQAAKPAAEYARAHPEFSVGLHFDVAEWRFEKGEWKLAYRVIDPGDSAAIRAEFERQLGSFQRLMGRTPTHLDSHQHAHQSEPSRALLLAHAERLGVPLRGCDPAVKHCGSFYGQTAQGEPYLSGISPSQLLDLLEKLEPGWAEIGCHPGYATDLDSVYLSEREEEVRVLCSSEVRQACDASKVRLRSFHHYLAWTKHKLELQRRAPK